MGSWTGWQAQLLTAANLLHTAGNGKFMGDWHAHSNTDCRNNPVDISRVTGSSTRCAPLPGTTRHAQNYSSHANAASAFNHELHSGNFPHLLAALESGDPYKVSDPNAVASDLSKWGSGVFAAVYHNEVVAAQGGGGGGAGGKQTGAHSGWNDLRHSINHNLPRALAASERNTRIALRAVSRARKVRL